MISSDARPITYRGKPALLYVIRNDGFCWGRVVLPDGTNLDVNTAADHYHRDDESALDAFERATKHTHKVEPAVGWPMEWPSNIQPQLTKKGR